MNALIWSLIFALWICAAALIEPLALGWRTRKLRREEEKRQEVWMRFYARNPCRSSNTEPWRRM